MPGHSRPELSPKQARFTTPSTGACHIVPLGLPKHLLKLGAAPVGCPRQSDRLDRGVSGLLPDPWRERARPECLERSAWDTGRTRRTHPRRGPDPRDRPPGLRSQRRSFASPAPPGIHGLTRKPRVGWHPASVCHEMKRLILTSLRPMPCASYQWSSAVRVVPSSSLILATPFALACARASRDSTIASTQPIWYFSDVTRSGPAQDATIARTIRFPAGLRERIAADAERCGRSFEGQVISLLRRHYGEDVDIAPSPAEILAMATGSLAGMTAR